MIKITSFITGNAKIFLLLFHYGCPTFFPVALPCLAKPPPPLPQPICTLLYVSMCLSHRSLDLPLPYSL